MAVPPHERPTAQQLANGGPGQSFAGQPANVCPSCGAAMFSYRVSKLDTRIIRYERCRNCQKKFVTRQPNAEIVREISDE